MTNQNGGVVRFFKNKQDFLTFLSNDGDRICNEMIRDFFKKDFSRFEYIHKNEKLFDIFEAFIDFIHVYAMNRLRDGIEELFEYHIEMDSQDVQDVEFNVENYIQETIARFNMVLQENDEFVLYRYHPIDDSGQKFTCDKPKRVTTMFFSAHNNVDIYDTTFKCDGMNSENCSIMLYAKKYAILRGFDEEYFINKAIELIANENVSEEEHTYEYEHSKMLEVIIESSVSASDSFVSSIDSNHTQNSQKSDSIDIEQKMKQNPFFKDDGSMEVDWDKVPKDMLKDINFDFVLMDNSSVDNLEEMGRSFISGKFPSELINPFFVSFTLKYLNILLRK